MGEAEFASLEQSLEQKLAESHMTVEEKKKYKRYWTVFKRFFYYPEKKNGIAGVVHTGNDADGGRDCGCQSGFFCKYDHGNKGHCTTCPSAGRRCQNDGLPPKGVEDCI